MKEFDYELNYKRLDFTNEETRKLYRIGRGEQGVLLVRPYTDDICAHWRFKNPEIAVTFTVDMDLDFHARYFMNGYFAYVATDGLSTDNMVLGAGKMFTFRNNVYVDPKVVYDMGEKTTNLTLGFGFKF